MSQAVASSQCERADLPRPVSRPTAEGLMPLPLGSTALVASANSGPERPARFIAALRGCPSPLRLTFGMWTPRLVVVLLTPSSW